MNFRLGSMFAISSIASAIVVASTTATTPVSAAPPWKCATTRFYHASHCLRTQWSQGNLVVQNDGQVANTSNQYADYVCPIPQSGDDANPASWPVKTVQLNGWANPVGVTVRVCATYNGGGGAYCAPATEHPVNRVHWTAIDASDISGFDYMYLSIGVPGVSGGSMNTFFGYSITTYGNEYSTC